MNKLICWDLDFHIGCFDRIEAEMQGKESDCLSPPEMRTGIPELLEKMTQEGAKHVITSSAIREYIERSLELANIREHFSAIYDRKDICEMRSGLVKVYTPVIEQFGISKEEAHKHVIVLGDSERDRAADLDNVVLIHQNRAWRYNANILEAAYELLRSAGKGFYEGFNNLHDAADIKQKTYDDFTIEKREIEFMPGVVARFEYSYDGHEFPDSRRFPAMKLLADKSLFSQPKTL